MVNGLKYGKARANSCKSTTDNVAAVPLDQPFSFETSPVARIDITISLVLSNIRNLEALHHTSL